MKDVKLKKLKSGSSFSSALNHLQHVPVCCFPIETISNNELVFFHVKSPLIRISILRDHVIIDVCVLIHINSGSHVTNYSARNGVFAYFYRLVSA